ncbi:MAG: AGE family epimerase/isomerase [Pseudomonadota bacterium]
MPADKMETFAAYTAAADRYRHWITAAALPFWATRGRDERHGGSIERVEADGSIDRSVPTRVRVQARQIFVYAAADELGCYAAAHQTTESLWRFLESYCRCEHRAGYGHTVLWPDGPNDGRLDLYDHAFYLLATAWYFRTRRDPAAKLNAEAIVTMLDARLAHSSGGWLEGDYDAPWRRQNPHMHLFEAFMAWFEATHEQQWLDRAAAIYALFERVFFDADHGLVLEYFRTDWSRPESASDNAAEPGHLLEWVWLLDWYQRLAGVDTEAMQVRLFETAVSTGLDKGVLIDTLNVDGSQRERTRRLWPMTEYIKASCVRVSRGDDTALAHATQAINALLEAFRLSPEGTYVDRLDTDNRVTDARAPVSSLYHLMAAYLEIERLGDVSLPPR